MSRPPRHDVTRRVYRETLDLLVEARNYAAFRLPRERRGRDDLARLKMSCESFRVTARLTQSLAWLLALRAVEAGEISRADWQDDRYRLGGRDVCLDAAGGEDEDLPPGLRDLLRRSLDLYRRLARLDAAVAEQAAAGR